MTAIMIPAALREKLGEAAVQALVDLINQVEEHAKDRTVLAEEMGKLRAEIAQVESRLIRWMFIFWIGQFASIVGVLTAILFAFFKA